MNNFLKIVFTLLSVRGKEVSIKEAASWRGDYKQYDEWLDGLTQAIEIGTDDDYMENHKKPECRPSHCTFFGDEKIKYPETRGICMSALKDM